MRTDIYRNVARGDRMSSKIDMLLNGGVIEDVIVDSHSSLHLTPIGEEVALLLERAVIIMDGSSGH